MTIYILGTPQALDDKSLIQMINGIAQVLCNAHWVEDQWG